MLDFGATSVASPFETLSPGHDDGTFSGSDTFWNTITSNTPPALRYSDDTPASGVTMVLGQEASVGNGIISYSTNIEKTNLAGSGAGSAGQQSPYGVGSIYEGTAAGRDGFFGGGSSTAGAAIGLRLDGLAAGDYIAYMMGRNTNTNAPSSSASLATSFHVTTGASSGTFTFGSAPAEIAANLTYASDGYADEYNSFDEGNNFVAISFNVADGDSVFIAADSAGTDARGFLNMVQIVAVPEPSSALLGALGCLFLTRRRR